MDAKEKVKTEEDDDDLVGISKTQLSVFLYLFFSPVNIIVF